MLPPSVSLHALASAITCLCSTGRGANFASTGLRNLSATQSESSHGLEQQLTRIEHQQTAALWLLAEQRAAASWDATSQPLMTPSHALQTVLSILVCRDAGLQFDGPQRTNHDATDDRFRELNARLTTIERTQAAILQLLRPAALQPASTEAQASAAAAPACNTAANATQVTRYALGDDLSFDVLCLNSSAHGPGWLVVQQRFDGRLDFDRSWRDYKEGFGAPRGEFFLGLEKLHLLTHHFAHELLFVLQDFENSTRHALYDGFAIASEEEHYALSAVGQYSGDAGDSFSAHRGAKFSTYDRDNDWEPQQNCARNLKGGWWHAFCLFDSNLNGEYIGAKYPDDKFAEGILWKHFRGYGYSLKSVQMAIRRKV